MHTHAYSTMPRTAPRRAKSDRTTIAIPPAVRNRLRKYGTKDMTYAEILTRLMDEHERDRFVAEMRELARRPDGWVRLEDL